MLKHQLIQCSNAESLRKIKNNKLKLLQFNEFCVIAILKDMRVEFVSVVKTCVLTKLT